jgi:hypothetical protein
MIRPGKILDIKGGPENAVGPASLIQRSYGGLEIRMPERLPVTGNLPDGWAGKTSHDASYQDVASAISMYPPATSAIKLMAKVASSFSNTSR